MELQTKMRFRALTKITLHQFWIKRIAQKLSLGYQEKYLHRRKITI